MKKRYIVVVAVMVAVMLITGFSMGTDSKEHRISHDQVYQLMRSDHPPILLDVRTWAEYNGGHLQNSVLIPIDRLKEKVEEELPDKEALIVVYCQSGNRSAKAVGILNGLGYGNVYDMGGINTWRYGIIK